MNDNHIVIPNDNSSEDDLVSNDEYQLTEEEQRLEEEATEDIVYCTMRLKMPMTPLRARMILFSSMMLTIKMICKQLLMNISRLILTGTHLGLGLRVELLNGLLLLHCLPSVDFS